MLRKRRNLPIFIAYPPPREQVQNPITGVMEERRLTYEEILLHEKADLQNYYFRQANFEPFDLSHIIRRIEEYERDKKKANKRPYSKHGYSKHPLYKNWAMLRHGSRKGGVLLCPAWEKDFGVYMHWALREGGYTREVNHIIRRDGAIGYTPENCYFGTKEEANLARRGRVTAASSSGHAGIFKIKHSGRWVCHISRPDGLHKLGSFDSKQAAIDAKEAWLRGD